MATAVDRRGVIRPGETVVVAVSGGPDSTALLDALHHLGAPRRWQLVVVHVDHGLRRESAGEGEQVAALARGLGLPFRGERVTVTPGSSLQERARDARRAALIGVAEQVSATAIALGHTADDQAETVLMRLLTTASPVGVAAMRERQGRAVRPLLRVWREQTIEYCATLGLHVAADPSNADRRFLRARVRHDVIPALEVVFPAARRRLFTLALRQQRLLEHAGR
ncbi:MAG: tRNA lysidine(34) synthetase TilS, partial [Candidatus Dormibacteraeota bacterium]|nr:tRNA lysidine(34) synthetase TilS [Candidatus Dormibacteraeota bacterium]